MKDERYGQAAYSAFHNNCDSTCDMWDKWPVLAPDVKQAWIDAAKAARVLTTTCSTCPHCGQRDSD